MNVFINFLKKYAKMQFILTETFNVCIKMHFCLFYFVGFVYYLVNCIYFCGGHTVKRKIYFFIVFERNNY